MKDQIEELVDAARSLWRLLDLWSDGSGQACRHRANGWDVRWLVDLGKMESYSAVLDQIREWKESTALQVHWVGRTLSPVSLLTPAIF